MATIDRIILSIYTFVMAVLALGVVLLSLRLISLQFIETSLTYIYGQWEAGVVGLLFFMISFRLLFAGVRNNQGKEAIVHHNAIGDVHISLAAVANLVEKTARHVKGVRNVKIDISHINDALKVGIKAVVSPDSNIPVVSAEIQKRVHENVKNTVGIDLVDISIVINNISNEFKPKRVE